VSESERRNSMRRERDRQYVRRDELESIVQRAVAAGIRDYQCECVFDLNPEEVKQVENMLFAVKELGDGDLATGIGVIRDNNQFVAKYRREAEKLGLKIITRCVMVALTILGLAVVGGVIVWVRQVSGRG